MTSQTETVTSSSLRRDNLNPPPQNKKANFKNSLDREYKLQFSDKKSPTKTDSLANTRDQLSMRNLEKSPPQESKYQADSQRDANFDQNENLENNQYKQGLQGLRSTLSEMKERANKNELSYKQQSVGSNDSQNLTQHEKAIVKRRFNERENQIAEEQQLAGTSSTFSNLQRSPESKSIKRTVHLAYKQREKEIADKIKYNQRNADDFARPQTFGDVSSKDFSHLDRSLSRTFGNSGDQFRGSNTFTKSQGQWREEKQANDDQQEGYFTNKDLMKSKYQQLESDLIKQKQRAQERKEAKGESLRKGVVKQPQSYTKHEESYGKNHSRQNGRGDEGKQEELEDSLEYGRNEEVNNGSDGFYKALTNREKKLNEQFQDLEREKGRSTKSLTYRDPLFEEREITRDEVEQMRSVYTPGNDINDRILAAELQRIREENKRMDLEIQEIHRRHDVERRLKSEKLTTADLSRTWTTSGDLLSSKQLERTKNERKQDVQNDYDSIVRSNLVKKTMQRARKDMHKKLDRNKQENAWSQAKSNRRSHLITSDVPLHTTSRSSKNKFSAGTSEVHLRESSFLLAHGVPTTYISDRDVHTLSRRAKQSTSKQFRM